MSGSRLPKVDQNLIEVAVVTPRLSPCPGQSFLTLSISLTF